MLVRCALPRKICCAFGLCYQIRIKFTRIRTSYLEPLNRFVRNFFALRQSKLSEPKENKRSETSMEYTLEDALETLKDTQKERCNDIETLMDAILKKGSVALSERCSPEDLNKMQRKFVQKLLYRILEEEPKDYPIPGTSDLDVQVLGEVQEEVRNAEELFDKMQSSLTDIKQDILYLTYREKDLQKMKDIYVGRTEVEANTNYYNEYRETKHMLRKVKEDLQQVLDILFPHNEDFRIFVTDLLSAYAKGGNDIYVEVEPDIVELVNFLLDASIVSYHRNDKNKIRLMDML